MSAVILAFPRPAPVRVLPFTPAWCAQHRPRINAAMDLLAADDAKFAQRCALMADEEGRDQK